MKPKTRKAKRPFKIKFLCSGCGAMHDTDDQATECCPGEEVFLCGRRKRVKVGQHYVYRVCLHFDRRDAMRCRNGSKTAGCTYAG